VAPGIELGTLASVARNSDYWTTTADILTTRIKLFLKIYSTSNILTQSAK
jgi:hypothetical protein